MDWTRSGRVDSFEFRMLTPARKPRPIGWLGGVTGGSITWDLNSDTKVSGSIDVVDQAFVNNCLIEAWYIAALDGETERTLLGTFFAGTTDGRYENGIYTGTIELKSALARHTDDKLRKNFVLAKGKSALGYYKRMFSWLGGWPAIHGVRDRRMRKTHIVEMGRTPYEALHYIASYLDAEIAVDPRGKTVLQRRTPASQKPVAFTVPTDSRSVTLEGVDISSTQSGTPNCVALRFEGQRRYRAKVKTGSGKVVKGKADGIDCAKVAAAIHRHLVTHSAHGYRFGGKGTGSGYCPVVVDGRTYQVRTGDYDCSGSVIAAWRAALSKTRYAGRLDGASYTGNMRAVFLESGLFEARAPGESSQAGDVYLNEGTHAAMSQGRGRLTEFLSDRDGIPGDGGGGESIERGYYSFPWDATLHYNGRADTTASGGKKKAVYKTRSKTERVRLRSVAAASPSSSISRQSTGRWITETYTVNNLHPMTQARLDELARARLKSASRYTISYTFRTFYLPVHIGEVIRFRQGRIRCDGLVTKIDMDLSPGAMMAVTIRKVRSL